MKEQIINLMKEGMSVKDIQETLGISEYKWKKLGMTNISKYTNIFSEINEESAYWLGFLWADGSLTKNTLELEVKTDDEAHLQKLVNALSYISIPKISRRTRHNAITSRISVTDKLIATTLRELGFDLKSKRIIPNISDNMLQHFIRGYFDGDGSCIVRDHNGNIEYRADISGPKEFIEFIQPYLPESSNEEIIENKTWVSKRIYWYSKEKVLSVLQYLIQNSTIKLERKYSPMLH